MSAFPIPGETLTLNQDGSFTVQQRYSMPQSYVEQWSPQPPTLPSGAWELESVSVNNLEAGMAEGAASWRLPNSTPENGSAGNLRNISVEVVASTREEPITVFKGTGNFDFAGLDAKDAADARNAGQGLNPDGSNADSVETAIEALSSDAQKNLAKYIAKGIEYFLSPSITVRVSGRADTVNTSNVGKAYASGNLPVPGDMKPDVPNAQGGNYEWLLTSITSRSAPAADKRDRVYFDVTEEYLLSGPAGWDQNLYATGTGTIIDNA